MALSHQWFIQWSSPPAVLADINSRYKNVNSWNNAKPEWAWGVTLQDIGDKYNYPDLGKYDEENTYDFEKPRRPSNEASRAAGMTLWLAMLGVARAPAAAAETSPFSTLYKWKQVDYQFPSENARSQAIASGKYIPQNVLPLGLEVWGSRVWVTFPNWRGGVPATLATVPLKGGEDSPLLTPYPDWSYHAAYNDDSSCSGMTSVFRVNVDPCGRLWVLDSGQINSQSSPIQKCPPSIFVFDLQTDELLNRYVIPHEFVLQDSLYSNIVVDTRTEDCSDVHVYMADTWRFGLVVFRERDQEFWRFSHHLFYPDPLASNFTLHGLRFEWPDGIFGMAITPIRYQEERLLYFHPLASYREFYVSTAVLRDSSRINNSSREFNLIGESRGLFGQSSASAIDRNGVMFYGLVSKDSVGCWDTKKLYEKWTLGEVARDHRTLIFPNDLKVDQEQEQSIWVLSNRLPMFQADSLNEEDYNFHIMFANTKEAVKGTNCDPVMKTVF